MPASAESRKPSASRREGGVSQRRAARLAAVQALYQIEMTDTPAERVVPDFLSHGLGQEIDGVPLANLDRAFFGGLVIGVSKDGEELDDMLSAMLAEAWPIERLETLLKIILRAGAYELAHRPEIPAQAVVSEYVALAHAFFDGKEPGMANGVLDALARYLRSEEFDADGAGTLSPEIG